MLPSFLAESDVSTGHLVRVLPRWNVPTGQLCIVYHDAQQPPRKVVAFRDFVIDALKARPRI